MSKDSTQYMFYVFSDLNNMRLFSLVPVGINAGIGFDSMICRREKIFVGFDSGVYIMSRDGSFTVLWQYPYTKNFLQNVDIAVND